MSNSFKTLKWCWKAMRQRCNNPRCKAFGNYGARGIKVCKEWDSFEAFYEWAIRNGWHKGLEIDRIDNDGEYSPENCRWVKRRENVNNRRMTVLITVNDDTKPLTEWAEIIGADRAAVRYWYDSHGIEYASNRIAEAIRFGYIERDFSRNHHKRVRCLETGEVFDSIKSAADSIGASHGFVSNMIKQRKKAKGHTFVLEVLA